MKKLAAGFIALAGMVFTTNASAAVFNFDISFDGTNVIVNAGSDTPAGTVLSAGDSFMLTFSATGDNFWRVDNDYNVFVPLSFSVIEGAARTVDITTDFLLDGSIVNNTFETDVLQSSQHIGAQRFDLDAGLEFDVISMLFELKAINTLGLTTIADVADIFSGFGQAGVAPFFRANDISFVNGAAVPLPAAALLYVTMAAAGGLGLKRRKKAKA